jgi:nucleotide-binding universal stress UspA family protein
MYNKALVALDGSKQSFKAVEAARQLAEAGSVKEIVLIYVMSIPHQAVSTDGMNVSFIPEYQEGQSKLAREVIDKACAMVGSQVQVQTMIETGSPSETIIKTADKGKFDLVIIGNRGLNQLQRLFLGSVSAKVVSSVGCSVLVVK